MIYPLLRSILFRTTDPEWIHGAAMHALRHTPLASILTAGRSVPGHPLTLWDMEFRNTLGLAAGFDKDAEAIPAWRALGFGHVEVGTITRHPQPGNPTPRIFRCPAQKALVNRMGFPNKGADAIRHSLETYRNRYGFDSFRVSINIGKSKITPLEEAAGDYLHSFKTLHEFADTFVVNVSSPNTPGLRTLQSPEQLEPIMAALQEHNHSTSTPRPLLVKIAPDLEPQQVLDIVGVAERTGLAGIVATNTTLDHSSIPLRETGGLSGRPLTSRSTEIIRFLKENTSLPIVGVGGVFTQEDVQEKLQAGARLVQLYTGFVYEGPLVAHKIFSKG